MVAPLFVALSLLIPAIASPLMLIIRRPVFRKAAVTAISAAMILNAALLAAKALGIGAFSVSAAGMEWFSWLASAVDVAVILAILYFGFRMREWKVVVPTVAQALLLFCVEVLRRPAEPEILFKVDGLGLVLLTISSVLGPVIAWFALGYMERHEQRHPEKKSRQNRFFAVIFLFLFAMNAMSITDSLLHFYAFWEITTLCSFLLIGYDRTRTSFVSARRALWMNSVGGLFFIAGIAALDWTAGSVSLTALLQKADLRSGALLVGVMLICCAGFVKSAQLPFAGWLLGAMVAPTPVSALLHSSTMVKAGVYIILRLSPLFGGRLSGLMVALVGSFTFMAAAAMAIGQRNGKRVLAYSTISNLGLIIALAGLGGPAALAAAILLMIYHAVSKALLFLCMGTVEQGIGSRMVEDMFGVFTKMPYTTTIMVFGMISMALPPFGVLVMKWLALEEAVKFPPALVLVVLGSAFTIVFWVKWLGATLTVYHSEKVRMELLPVSMRASLGFIAALVLALTALMPVLNNAVAAPAVAQLLSVRARLIGATGGLVLVGGNLQVEGAFLGVPGLLIVLCAGFVLLFLLTKLNRPKIVAPYACGELAGRDLKGGSFVGPQDKIERVVIHNYYFSGIFGEKRLLPVCSFISALLILILFGVC